MSMRRDSRVSRGTKAFAGSHGSLNSAERIHSRQPPSEDHLRRHTA